jgi:AcrR family transcriptional regulator
VRNRARILNAARAQITGHGPGVGMDDIAAAAGVAVGTLYRHFPTKDDLVAAVVDEYMDRIADDSETAAERVREGADPRAELFAFVARVVAASADNHAVKSAAATLAPGTDLSSAAMERAATAIGAVLSAAKGAGSVRADLSVDDVYLLVVSAPYDQGEHALKRWLALVLPGLQQEPSRSLS